MPAKVKKRTKFSSPIKMQKFYLLLLVFSFSFLPLGVKGAMLYLSPLSGEYHQGDNFMTEVRLDTEGELINTCEVNLNFSSNSLEVIDISNGGSILSLWPKIPIFSNSQRIISFIGGIPGGFSGDGKLLSIIFQATTPASAEVNFQDSSKVLLNDGFGTPAKVTVQRAVFTILAEKLEIPKDEWKEELEKDNIPPESFEIEISKNPTIFEGKYFIVFSTIDKQTGIDYYKVREGEREWKRGESPYLLEDQSLRNKILVKAVDKADNERVAEITPPYKITGKDIVILFVILIGILVIWWLIRKLKAKK